MKSIHKIAILDTVVNNKIVDVEKIVHLDDDILNDEFNTNKDISNMFHGTLCAKIIKKYAPDAILVCIKVLEEDNSGSIFKLEKALEWCFYEQIFIINLSLGTVNHLNRPRLLSVVNYYANKGMVIIGATANNGLLTYPASFSNVVGVASNEVMNSKQLDSINLGIDIQEQAENAIEIEGEFFLTPKGNSFATPYVSTIVSKLMEKTDKSYCVSEIKNQLYNQDYHTYPMASCNVPDWITTAYFVNKNENKKGYYFKVANDIEKADTIILNSKAMLQLYKKYNKHMVYLGDEEVLSPNPMRFFWSKQSKIRQIYNTHVTEDLIKIPILIFEQYYGFNGIETLCELKKQFENEGYNFYAISNKIESVLYDIEYIPEELLEQGYRIYSFVYWQIFIRKSNIVVLETNDLKKMLSIFMDTDIAIKISSINDSVYVSINCNNQVNEIVYKQFCLKKLAIDVFRKVTSYFNEDKNKST